MGKRDRKKYLQIMNEICFRIMLIRDKSSYQHVKKCQEFFKL
jgi:hypothetical protein